MFKKIKDIFKKALGKTQPAAPRLKQQPAAITFSKLELNKNAPAFIARRSPLLSRDSKNRSKYSPHQGEQEKARRRAQMEAGHV